MYRVMQDGNEVTQVRDMNDFYGFVAGEVDMGNGTEEEYTLHPEDMAKLVKLEVGLRIDKGIEAAGVSARQQRVYTSNLALLNTYIIARLIRVGQEQWADNIPDDIAELIPLADAIILAHEEKDIIYKDLGMDTIIDKAITYGEVAGATYTAIVGEGAG